MMSSAGADGCSARNGWASAGTLDPDATGVLLVGLGRGDPVDAVHERATQILRSRGELVLGGSGPSTLDAAGEVTGRWDQRHVSLEEARKAAEGFVGDLSQVPPMVSAVKVGGKRLPRAGPEAGMRESTGRRGR